jgi:thioredoxin 1
MPPYDYRTRLDPVAGNANANASPVSFVSAADWQEKVLNAQGPVAVEFMNFGCGHCRKAEPMVHDVAKAIQNQVKVYQVIVPQNMELARRYNIPGTPTFIMFQGGAEVGRANPEITPIGIRRAILGPFAL